MLFSFAHLLRMTLASGALIVVLGGCQRQHDADSKTIEIRIASPDFSVGSKPSAGGGPTEVMRSTQALEKAFAADHIKVTWSFFKGAGPAINEGIANGQIDFAYLGDLAAIIGRANGLDTRLIAISDHGANEYLATPADSPIQRFSDLRGKRIAIFRGTADQLAFARTLAENGLSERDVREINLDWNAARSALVAGQVDAAWGGASLLMLREKNLAKVPLSTKDGSRTASLQAGLVVSSSFAKQHPELVQRVVTVLAQSASWAAADENRDALVALLSQQSSIPQAVYRTDYAGDDLHFRFSPLIDAFTLKRLQASIEAAHTAGLIRQTFDAASWADPRYAEAAVAAQAGIAHWKRYNADGSLQQ